ncbi:hypothetical protein HK097_008705 [Rhizophlyctis rosea]|uniref:Uncharacterized protein n=1 Tax=Rhizophlyctis rosea TaxID=64517 RepID=A0AAD5X1J2_9FUNG|nr:hypothetical protein HK097_008705 [Rhizophlyctis rosea]
MTNEDISFRPETDDAATARDIHGLGIFIKDFFPRSDYFTQLTQVHQFQLLTESNKPNLSFRKGIYLSPVHQTANNETHFNLLRCSTNLSGPTESFTQLDTFIVQNANTIAQQYYPNSAPLNHVLAQVYENIPKENNAGKERKARIKSHSDKTKDMPQNGLMAFCTFYSPDIVEKAKSTGTDWTYKNASVLTTLRWRLKKCITNRPDLPETFDITLHPNSLFLCPLSTNRLYTHEIVPPDLSVDKLPTRLGYVIRCSKTQAVHVDGVTFIEHGDGRRVPLKQSTEENVALLRQQYFEENTTADVVEYGDVYFSMNDGDYKRPIVIGWNPN